MATMCAPRTLRSRQKRRYNNVKAGIIPKVVTLVNERSLSGVIKPISSDQHDNYNHDGELTPLFGFNNGCKDEQVKQQHKCQITCTGNRILTYDIKQTCQQPQSEKQQQGRPGGRIRTRPIPDGGQ